MAFDFASIKTRVTEKAEELGKLGSAAAKKTAEKGQLLAQKAKLTADLAAERKNLAAAQRELGQRYMEKYGEAVDEELCTYVAAVKDAMARVAEKENQLSALNPEESITVEITEEETAPAEEQQ